MRDGFIFYKSFYEAIKELDTESQCKIYNAIFEYQYEEKEPELTGILKSLWSLIKPQLDANNSRYENGLKGGRKPNENQTETKLKPKQNQNETKAKPKEKEKEKVNDKEKENEKENVAVAEKEKEFGLITEEATAVATAIAPAEVFRSYMNNINPTPTPIEVNLLEAYLDDTPHELILYAIEKAVENKARNMGYIKGILNSWNKKGIATLEEAKEEASKKNNVEPMQNVFEKVRKKNKGEEMAVNGI